MPRSRKSVRIVVIVSVLVVVAAFAVAGPKGPFSFFTSGKAAGNPAQPTTRKTSKRVTAPAATFPADQASLGDIPDGVPGVPACGDFGSPRVVTFTVSGMTAPLSDVRVSITGTHTWVADLDVTLFSPGDNQAQVIFSQTGAVAPNDCADNSDFSGPYLFADAAPALPTWWDAAAAATPTQPVAPGNYRAVTPGGDPGGGAVTPITPTFAGLSTAEINGTWKLVFRDGGDADTGTITAASLTLSTASPAAHQVVDFDGDGKTDAAIVRNLGTGSSGQLAWYIHKTTEGDYGQEWGLATDFIVPGDFDGDNKTDITVWRGGDPFESFFYIFESSTNTVRVDQFGQSGDDPTVIGDYDGDGHTDPAVYRAGANAGDHSFWYFRSSVNGLILGNEFGQNGDFPAPGDYNGDGKNDFVVQRNAGGGNAIFFVRNGNGSVVSDDSGDSSLVFGTPTDNILPGDYDGDGKTDFAIARGLGGQLAWFIRPSSTGVIPGAPTYLWGLSSSDLFAQGDYDGDGRTDIAVFRPNADPAQNYFYPLGSTAGPMTPIEWGQVGDYPVANYNHH